MQQGGITWAEQSRGYCRIPKLFCLSGAFLVRCAPWLLKTWLPSHVPPSIRGVGQSAYAKSLLKNPWRLSSSSWCWEEVFLNSESNMSKAIPIRCCHIVPWRRSGGRWKMASWIGLWKWLVFWNLSCKNTAIGAMDFNRKLDVFLKRHAI